MSATTPGRGANADRDPFSTAMNDPRGDTPAQPGADTPPVAEADPAMPASKVRCPSCQNPIQLAKESAEVLCPACGGTFSLRDARYTDTTATMTTLGKFQLLERLGIGGFGAVWKARDTELDRIVALKIPHAGLLIEKGELERFQREARATAQLRHPHIVTVHNVELLNGLPVIVAEYVPGVPLKDLREVRKLTFRQTAALVALIAEALEYAHSMGVVHRDVKPANIMLLRGAPVGTGPDELADIGKPMILDFGLASRDAVETTMTIDGQILGTPAYMSPEQAAGKAHMADRRSDVYSVGVVMYELLTNEMPFRGSRSMILQQTLFDEPAGPRKINDKIPRDLETICLKCMSKLPTGRYATARELADDLRRFLNGEPIVARPVGMFERTWRWVRRNQRVALLLSSLAFVLIAGTAISSTLAVIALEKADLEMKQREKTQRAVKRAEENATIVIEQAQRAVDELRKEAQDTDDLAKQRERRMATLKELIKIKVSEIKILDNVGKAMTNLFARDLNAKSILNFERRQNTAQTDLLAYKTELKGLDVWQPDLETTLAQAKVRVFEVRLRQAELTKVALEDPDTQGQIASLKEQEEAAAKTVAAADLVVASNLKARNQEKLKGQTRRIEIIRNTLASGKKWQQRLKKLYESGDPDVKVTRIDMDEIAAWISEFELTLTAELAKEAELSQKTVAAENSRDAQVALLRTIIQEKTKALANLRELTDRQLDLNLRKMFHAEYLEAKRAVFIAQIALESHRVELKDHELREPALEKEFARVKIALEEIQIEKKKRTDSLVSRSEKPVEFEVLLQKETAARAAFVRVEKDYLANLKLRSEKKLEGQARVIHAVNQAIADVEKSCARAKKLLDDDFIFEVSQLDVDQLELVKSELIAVRVIEAAKEREERERRLDTLHKRRN